MGTDKLVYYTRFTRFTIQGSQGSLYKVHTVHYTRFTRFTIQAPLHMGTDRLAGVLYKVQHNGSVGDM